MFEVKNAVYVVYRGREFSYLRKHDDEVVILSHDQKDRELGFRAVSPRALNKTVASSDLEVAYVCNTRALYKGIECTVSDVEDEYAYLEYTLDYVKAKERGFKLVEPPVYETKVLLKHLEKIWYTKRPMWGFSLSEDEQVELLK